MALHEIDGVLVGFGGCVAGKVDWRKEQEDEDPDDELLETTPEDVVAILGFDPLELDDDGLDTLAGQGNPYRGEGGRYTSGEGGGSGDKGDKKDGPVAFHGTTSDRVASILKKGLVVTKDHRWGDPDRKLYAGERGKSVFFCRTAEEAEAWAFTMVGGHKPIAVIKVRFPKGVKLKQDMAEAGNELYHVGAIDPKWIVGIKTKEPLASWKTVKINEEEDVVFMVVVLDEEEEPKTNSFRTLIGGTGSGFFGHAGRKGEIGGSAAMGDGGFVRAGRLGVYHIGKRVEFRDSLEGIRRGTIGTVVDVSKDQITVRSDTGKRVHLRSTSDPFSKQRSWDRYIAFRVDHDPLSRDQQVKVREKAFREATLPLEKVEAGEHVVFMDRKMEVHIAQIVEQGKGDHVEVEEITGMRNTVAKSDLRRPKGSKAFRTNEYKTLGGAGNPYRGEGGRYTSGEGGGGSVKAKSDVRSPWVKDTEYIGRQTDTVLSSFKEQSRSPQNTITVGNIVRYISEGQPMMASERMTAQINVKAKLDSLVKEGVLQRSTVLDYKGREAQGYTFVNKQIPSPKLEETKVPDTLEKLNTQLHRDGVSKDVTLYRSPAGYYYFMGGKGDSSGHYMFNYREASYKYWHDAAKEQETGEPVKPAEDNRPSAVASSSFDTVKSLFPVGKIDVGPFSEGGQLDKRDPDLPLIASKSEEYGKASQYLGMQDGLCHDNTASAYKNQSWNKGKGKAEAVTGFAYNGSFWVRHSWLVKNSKVIETTDYPYDKYLGAVRGGKNLEEFLANPRPSKRMKAEPKTNSFHSLTERTV